MTRPLGGLERQFYQQNLIGSTGITAYLKVDAVLDRERLAAAFRALADRYPRLKSSVVADPFLRFAFEPKPQDLPFAALKKESEDGWRRLLETELLRPYAPGSGQAALHLILGEDDSELLLSVNHAVADGLSVHMLCRDLVAFYNGAVPEEAADRGPMEARFPRHYQGFRGWWKAIKFIFVLGKLGPALQVGGEALTVHTRSDGFTFDRLSELNVQAKSRGCNLFAVISALALQTIHQLYACKGEKDLSLNTPVSLRSQIDVGPDEIGVFLAGHLALYSITSQTDTWALAKDCHDTLRRGIEQGRPFLLTLLARGAKKPKKTKISNAHASHRPTISISNLGRVDDMPMLASAHVIDHRIVSAQSAKDPFAFVLIAYKGRLNIDIQTSLEKMGREAGPKILGKFRENLENLLKS